MTDVQTQTPPPAASTWPVVSLAKAHAQLTAPGQRFEIEEKVIRGVNTRTWKNAPATLRDIFLNGRTFQDREFLVYEDDRATFETFARATITLARQLQADGVKKGDRVAVIMRNIPEWPVAFWAGILAGAIVTPLNAWWTGPELEYGLADSGTKIAIVDDERLERITASFDALPSLEKVYAPRLAADPTDPKVRRLEDVIGKVNDWGLLADQPLPDVPLEPEDDATILYTSGTTGKPKGALGTHRNMTSNIMASGISATRNFLRAGQPLPESDPHKLPQRVNLLVVPMFHATGLSANLSPAMNSGGKIVLMRRWETEPAMALIEREKVNSTGGVPTIAWQLIEHPAREKYDLSSLMSVAYGGAPSAPELVRKIVEVFPASQPGNGWGMTETTATFTSHLGKDYENRPDSAGPAAPVGEMEIRDPADGKTVLAPNVVGELWVKGPQVVKGYWNKPEATAETFVNGWLRTGDLARLDDEGFLFIVDRAKDMLIRGGENIYCVEVENVLYDHPDVMDAALVGIPHKTLGEEPAAVVHLKPGGTADEAELKAFVRERLAAFKVPVKVVVWPETLPRNANGKIVKTELKKVFEGEA
ncbi:class I adenylate-forming enzyme family protein [Phenylobacterium sp.]|uniref:class I adenylate-forming enzyme family protein n=1 Tax=Phenylobacterium sp. TaxID=1871053 RepID=UPI002731BB68|nr:class I adenylate-forming enzyme family protein [Phenylobacterium sp.]MDP1599623.1 class I adenylate-forming enzyme family protein [Phenylobacterium sp.]MDP3591717.1 class I adenylate-forming enzyme family protein [Phenylobacterium sp.]